MKVQTSEATGLVLDWLVIYIQTYAATGGNPILTEDMMRKAVANGMASPSTDWAQGGPIIEREGISPAFNPSMIYERDARWKAFDCSTDGGHQFGPTPLVAAMRCYVASRLGEEVEVPDGLASHETDPSWGYKW